MKRATRPGLVLSFTLALAGCPSPAVQDHAGAPSKPTAPPQPVEEQARAEFAAGHWERAALLYGDAVERPGVSVHDRGLALVGVSESLSRLGLRAAAFTILAEMVAEGAPSEASEALKAMLAILSVPEAELTRAIAKLAEKSRAEVLAALGREGASRFHWFSAMELRNRAKYDEAIAEFGLVDGADRGRAQIAIGIVHVLVRHSVPATQAFQKARELAPSLTDTTEAARIRDLSLLLEGDTFYSASMTTTDASKKQIKVKSAQLDQALALWTKIPATSAFARDAAWQSGWATFTFGDYPATIAHLDTASKDADAYLPEAEYLRATTKYAMKEDAASKAAFDAFIARYAPAATGLDELQRKLDQASDAPAGLLALTLGRKASVDALPADLKAPAQHALGDRWIRDAAAWVDEIDGELSRFEALPASLRGSMAGKLAKSALESARDYTVPRFRALAGDRLLRESDDLRALVKSARAALATLSPTPGKKR